MSDARQPGQQTDPPEEFVKLVKDALDHLYDFPYLEHHPLADEAEAVAGRRNELASQRLRRELVNAIESLGLGGKVPFRDPRTRPYDLIRLHYVEGMTVQEVAYELRISRRQAHRDLRQGIESVAMVMWAHRPRPDQSEPRARQLSSVRAEMERLGTRLAPADMLELIEHARQTVEPLASKRSVSVEVDLPQSPVPVVTNQAMAKQALINLFSGAVRNAKSDVTAALIKSDTGEFTLSLRYAPANGASQADGASQVVPQILQRLGWTLTEEDLVGGDHTLTLHLKARRLLVIDDNEGLVALLEDYLTGHACRVMAATTAQQGLSLAQEAAPDAIVLDVMMPEIDGWEILQRLRTHPDLVSTPVIVCSVISDPDLAYALGASLFLPKPISRDAVLQALHQLEVV